MKYRQNKFSDKTFEDIFISKLLKNNWMIVLCVIMLCFVGVAALYSASGGHWDPWAKIYFRNFSNVIYSFLTS